MSDKMVVMVLDSDMISAKSLLKLLSESVDSMKKQLSENNQFTEIQKAAAAGAIEAVTDLHNLVLSQIQDSRVTEAFEDAGNGNGEFDA